MEGFMQIPITQSSISVIDDEFASMRSKFDSEMKKMEEEMSKFRHDLMNKDSNLFGKSMITSSRLRSEFRKGPEEETKSESFEQTKKEDDNEQVTEKSSFFYSSNKDGETKHKESSTTKKPEENEPSSSNKKPEENGKPQEGNSKKESAKEESKTSLPKSESNFESSRRFHFESTPLHPSAMPPVDGMAGMQSPLIQTDGDSKMLKLRFDVSQYKPDEIVVKTVDSKLLVHAKHEEKADNRSVYREYNREFLLPKGTDPEAIKSSLSKDGVLTVEATLPTIAQGETKIPISFK